MGSDARFVQAPPGAAARDTILIAAEFAAAWNRARMDGPCRCRWPRRQSRQRLGATSKSGNRHYTEGEKIAHKVKPSRANGTT